MTPAWQRILLDYLRNFVILFVVFTAFRYFGLFGYAESSGDLTASMRAELLPSLLWASVLVAIRVFLRR